VLVAFKNDLTSIHSIFSSSVSLEQLLLLIPILLVMLLLAPDA
jgi:hypothetical protein